MQDLIITLVQTNLVWEDIDANLAQFDQKFADFNTPTDIVVLPEMFSTGFSMNSKDLAEEMNGKTMEKMATWARQLNAVVTGSIIITEGGEYYNRLIWMRRDGSYETYDKHQLFKMGGEHQYYKAGTKRLEVTLKGWKICPLICYDLRFPVWARNTNDYDVLIYTANWPEARSHHWRSLLVARAIENQCYTIGVNRVGVGGKLYYSGNSMIVNPTGNIIKEKVHQESIITRTLSKDYLHLIRQKLPFLGDRDTFEIV